MNVSVFKGKTIKSITYKHWLDIEFTDGTTLEITSRYEGGLCVRTEIEETITEKRRRSIETDE